MISKYVTTNANVETTVDMGTRCSEVTVFNRQAAPVAPGNEIYVRTDGVTITGANMAGTYWIPAIYGASSLPLVCVNPDIVDQQISTVNSIVHLWTVTATLIVIMD